MANIDMNGAKDLAMRLSEVVEALRQARYAASVANSILAQYPGEPLPAYPEAWFTAVDNAIAQSETKRVRLLKRTLAGEAT
jgi:hypothetical protein